jgi:prolyl-tRNA synthetase
MRYSQSHIPTLRETPGDASPPGQKFLKRAGYLRPPADWLPLGSRALSRIEAYAIAALESAGAQPLRAAAPAHIAREIRSPKQLPQLWFQTCNSEITLSLFSPAREDLTELGARLIPIPFERAGSSLVVYSDAGETDVLACPDCAWAAPLAEAATATPQPCFADPDGDLSPEPLHTPGRKTIADVAAFTGQPEAAQMKSLVLVANDGPVLVMLRGDHQMSSAKFIARFHDSNFRPARTDEIVEWFGAFPGSLGPVGVTRAPIFADLALRGRRNMISGANRDDYHLRNVTPGEDFAAEFIDLRQAQVGDLCPACAAPVIVKRAFELAHCAAEAPVNDFRHASCRVSAARILRAAAELFHDQDGLKLPQSIAPIDLILIPTQAGDEAQAAAAQSLYDAAQSHQLTVLLDDRDERPGVKFKDADLIGAPFRITLGKKLAEGKVEFLTRATRQVQEIPLPEALSRLGGLRCPAASLS